MSRADGFDPVAFLEEAVAIPSHESIEEMRGFLLETLADRDVDARVHDGGAVLASRGTGGGPAVVLNTHIDTVAPHVPLERNAGVLTGRGACDAKGALAATLAAFFGVDPGDGRLTLAVTPDEERHSTGAHALLTDRDGPLDSADAVVVGEPTDLDVCTAARGRYELEVTLAGESAHAATPDAGANAVAALAPVLEAVGSVDEDAPAHDHLGRPTLTATTVAGGAARNQVPASCLLVLDRRPVPPETAATFRDRLTRRLATAAPDGVTVTVSDGDRPTPPLEAWATDRDEPIVEALAEETPGEIRPFRAATEASYFASRAPTAVFGPGSLERAHTRDESIRTRDIERAGSILARALAGLFDADQR